MLLQLVKSKLNNIIVFTITEKCQLHTYNINDKMDQN